MKKIYAESLDLFRQNALALFATIVLFEVILHFDDFFNYAGLLYFPLYAYIAYRVQRIFIFGPTEGSNIFSISHRGNSISVVNFIKFLVALFLLDVMPFLLIAGAVAFALSDQLDQLLDPMKFGAFIVFALLLHTIIKAFFGTIPPAILDQNPKFKLFEAFKFWHILMARLLMGSVPIVAISIALAVVLSEESRFFWPSVNFWLSSGLSALISAIDLFGTIISSVTLCSVYRMIVPAQRESVAE